MSKVIKLAIVDDSPFYRAGLISFIRSQTNFKITIQCSNGEELIHALESKKIKLDIIILDLEMPVMDGIKTVEYLSKHYPKIKILILTINNDKKISRYLIDKGVNGFLQKEDTKDEIVDAVNTIYKFDFYFKGVSFKTMAVKSEQINMVSTKDVALTTRELEILRLIFKKFKNKEIAEKLFISVRTVHGHRNKIRKKTNTRNSSELIQFAIKNNLISKD